MRQAAVVLFLRFRSETISTRSLGASDSKRKLLYCGDLYLPATWGYAFCTEHLSEIPYLIEREHIEVQQIAGVSVQAQDWKELGASLPVRTANR